MTSAEEAYLANAIVDEFVARSAQSTPPGPPPLHVPSPSSKTPAIDHVRERYPFCIVWTPLPLITWIFPFIGHMGICDSRGIIHDFAGPYYVSRDNMAFGNPVKYWYLFPEHVAGELLVNTSSTTVGSPNATGSSSSAHLDNQQLADAVRRFDRGIAQTTDHFKKTQFYNLFCNNCHSFVAHCLIAGEQMAKEADTTHKKVFKNKTWNMVTLTIYLFFFGRYVSWGRFLIAHIPFVIFVAIIAAIGWGASAAAKKM